ncbi:MAG TPA: hypothetical protein VFF30_11305 [Nitrososphaerales archaeon]|nr:hypothetical protein [Nitrososphaerales archaeon]
MSNTTSERRRKVPLDELTEQLIRRWVTEGWGPQRPDSLMKRGIFRSYRDLYSFLHSATHSKPPRLLRQETSHKNVLYLPTAEFKAIAILYSKRRETIKNFGKLLDEHSKISDPDLRLAAWLSDLFQVSSRLVSDLQGVIGAKEQFRVALAHTLLQDVTDISKLLAPIWLKDKDTLTQAFVAYSDICISMQNLKNTQGLLGALAAKET